MAVLRKNIVEWVDYFDVWGNQEEGYFVNDCMRLFKAELDEIDEHALFNLLKEKHVLKQDADFERFGTDWDMNGVEIFDTETGYMLGRFDILDHI